MSFNEAFLEERNLNDEMMDTHQTQHLYSMKIDAYV